jgi:hypothetical protein
MTEPTNPPPDPPQDPLTVMAEGAAQTHEIFLSYLAAGFTAEQALYLVGQVLIAHVRAAGTP